MRPLFFALALGSLFSTPSSARADGDGVYGRLEGDLIVDLGLGGGVGLEEVPRLALLGEARARYLDSAGLMLAVEGRVEGASRVLLGIDLRPLFLGRFLLGGSVGDRFLDLLIDSVGLDLGVALAPLDAGAGAALFVGLGFELPLVSFGAGVEGLSLRASWRYTGASPSDQWGPEGGIEDHLFGLSLVLRGQVSTGLQRWEPRRYR